MQQLVASSSALVDKGTQLYYERTKRPPEKIEKPWEAWLQGQHESAMRSMESRIVESPWIGGERLNQADISLTCAYTWMTLEQEAPPELESFMEIFQDGFVPIGQLSGLGGGMEFQEEGVEVGHFHLPIKD